VLSSATGSGDKRASPVRRLLTSPHRGVVLLTAVALVAVALLAGISIVLDSDQVTRGCTANSPTTELSWSLNQELATLARTDPLARLSNRRVPQEDMELLEARVALAKQHGRNRVESMPVAERHNASSTEDG
jgi:hypothetical protein